MGEKAVRRLVRARHIILWIEGVPRTSDHYEFQLNNVKPTVVANLSNAFRAEFPRLSGSACPKAAQAGNSLIRVHSCEYSSEIEARFGGGAYSVVVSGARCRWVIALPSFRT